MSFLCLSIESGFSVLIFGFDWFSWFGSLGGFWVLFQYVCCFVVWNGFGFGAL